MRNLVIDLGDLEYIYSDTINVFISSNRQMLEVSGRIAILAEHNKVQELLRRAGLDNIMRIYRSEAEMIADSKEILRQTSSYRVDELQQIANEEESETTPKSEFEDFRSEMGDQLEETFEDKDEKGEKEETEEKDSSSVPEGFGGSDQFDHPTQQIPITPIGNQYDELDKDEKTDLLIRHALDFSEFDIAKEGVYKFSVFASHARPYLFIYDQNQITILREYSVANVLKKLAPFFERNDSALSQKAKLKYLQNIVDILQDNYLPPGWEEMPESFQIPDSLKQ